MGRSAPRARPARAPPPPQVQPYDVIVCDLRMPERDGPAFSAILTRQYPALRQRVIVLTGDPGGDASRTVLTPSGRPWLRQPSPMTTIRHAMQDVLQAAPPAEAWHAPGLLGGLREWESLLAPPCPPARGVRDMVYGF